MSQAGKSFIAGLILIVLQFSSMLVEEVEAIPAFARRYQLSCAVCHVGFPKLNAFGEAFASNGYQLDEEDMTKHGIETGDNKLLLLPAVPLAVRVDSFFQARNDTAVKTDLQTPASIKLLSSAPITNNISYYFYFLANERGSVAGVEDAFLYFNNIYKGKDLDLRVGQFQVSDILFPREQRLTFQDYTYYTTAISNSGFQLTYDRSAELSYSFDIKDNLGMSFWAAVTNGNGIGVVNSNRNFDSDNFKNFYTKIQMNSGEHKVGIYGYSGREQNPSRVRNEFFRVGPDFTISLSDKMKLWGNYLYGEDGNPRFISVAPQRVKSFGGFSGLTYAFKEDWILTLLYNRVKVDTIPLLNAETMTANISYYIMRNFKVMLEGTGDVQPTSINHLNKTHTGVLGLVLAF